VNNIVVRKINGLIHQILINGEEVDSDDGETYSVPKGLLKGIRLSEMPKDVSFEVCSKIEEGTIILDTFPFKISKISNSKAYVYFEDSGRRKYWDGDVGFKVYMETKRDIVKEREKELGDLKFESYNDDGDYIFMTFSKEIEASTFDQIITTAEQLIKEIEGTVELAIGSPFKNVQDTRDEADFSLSVVIPLLRKLGFSNVRYNCGKREFGNDILFSRKSEFDDFESWGAQVKYGDISGAANSEIDQILSQIDDAFKVPFYDVYTRQKQRISKLLVVVSGRFTENAVEKICEKIESNAIKNNVVFLDCAKIDSIAEKFKGRTSDFALESHRNKEITEKLEGVKEEFESNLQKCNKFLERIRNIKMPKDFEDWSTGTTRLNHEEEQELQASMEAFYPVISNDALTHLKITRYIDFSKENWSMLNDIDDFFRWCSCYSSNLSTADFYECERQRIDETKDLIREGINIISRRISELQEK